MLLIIAGMAVIDGRLLKRLKPRRKAYAEVPAA